MRDYVVPRTVFAGIQIVENKALGKEVAYQFPEKGIVICGDVGHFRHKVTMAQFRIDIRAIFARDLDALAASVNVDRSTLSE